MNAATSPTSITEFDLRIPMGLMFALAGALLLAFGLATSGDPMYAKSLGFNANLDWSPVLLVFGLTMLVLGRRGQKRAALKPEKPGTVKRVRRGR